MFSYHPISVALKTCLLTRHLNSGLEAEPALCVLVPCCGWRVGGGRVPLLHPHRLHPCSYMGAAWGPCPAPPGSWDLTFLRDVVLRGVCAWQSGTSELSWCALGFGISPSAQPSPFEWELHLAGLMKDVISAAHRSYWRQAILLCSESNWLQKNWKGFMMEPYRSQQTMR